MNDPRRKLTEEQMAAMRLGREIGQTFITDEQFAKRFKATVNRAKEMFEKDGYHGHMMMAHLRNNVTGQTIVVPALFADWPPPDGRKFEATATKIADLAVAIIKRNPDPEAKKVADFIGGWEFARHRDERR